jgi:hypothetical protein
VRISKLKKLLNNTILGVPMNKHQFAFRIDPKLRDDFHAAAKAKGLKASTYIRLLMLEVVKKHKKEKQP